MRGSGRRGGAEVGAHNQYLAIRSARGISLDFACQLFWIVLRRDASFGSREIEPVKFQPAKPHVGMRIGDSRNHSPAVEIDELRLARGLGRGLIRPAA